MSWRSLVFPCQEDQHRRWKTGPIEVCARGRPQYRGKFQWPRRFPGAGIPRLCRFGRETNPDIALMDLRLPDGDGIKCNAALRHAAPDTRVIVLTTFDNDKNMYGAIQAGAHAFLLKDVPKADLLATIRTVHSGVYQLPATVAKRVA